MQSFYLHSAFIHPWAPTIYQNAELFLQRRSDGTSLPSLLSGRSSHILRCWIVRLPHRCDWRQTLEASLETPGGEPTGAFLASCSSLLLSARVRDQWPLITPLWLSINRCLESCSWQKLITRVVITPLCPFRTKNSTRRLSQTLKWFTVPVVF